MERYNVANCDESAYYFTGFSSLLEAAEALQFTKLHDPKAHIVKYEVQTEQERLKAELETVKRERDAAVKDLEASKSCGSCIHFEELAALMKDGDLPSKCVNCILERSQYVWRGLCAENGGAEDGQDHPD